MTTEVAGAAVAPAASAVPVAEDLPASVTAKTERVRTRGYAAAYKTVDAWRALAALGVVIFHESQGFLSMHPELARPAWVYDVARFGWLGVDMFFVISGYCIAAAAASSAARGTGTKAFLWARARRILPPYWMACLVLVGLASTLRVLATHGAVPQEVMRSPLVAFTGFQGGPLFWVSNVALLQLALRQGFVYTLAWTLCYEGAFYLITGLALWAFGRFGPRRLVAALNILTIVVAAGMLVSKGRLPYPLDMWPLFGCGAAVFTLLTAPDGWRSRGGLLAVGVLGATLVSYGLLAGPVGQGNILLFNQPILPVVCATMALVAALLLLRRYDDRLAAGPVGRLLVWIGTFSYSLYLTHFIGLSLTRGALSLARVPDSLDVIKMAASVVVCVVLARGFFAFGERPFMSSRRKQIIAEEVAVLPGGEGAKAAQANQ